MGGQVKVELLRVGAGESTASATDINDTSFATWSNHKTDDWRNMWIKSNTTMKPLKCCIKQPQEKLPVNWLFFPVQNPVISDLLLGSCHFSSLIFHNCSLKFSKQKVSYSEPFLFHLKGIYINTLKLCFWGKYVKETMCAKLSFKKWSEH